MQFKLRMRTLYYYCCCNSRKRVKHCGDGAERKVVGRCGADVDGSSPMATAMHVSPGRSVGPKGAPIRQVRHRPIRPPNHERASPPGRYHYPLPRSACARRRPAVRRRPRRPPPPLSPSSSLSRTSLACRRTLKRTHQHKLTLLILPNPRPSTLTRYLHGYSGVMDTTLQVSGVDRPARPGD